MKKDFIEIVWYIEDVLEVRPDLSKNQCLEVLEFVKKNHDCNVGINWEVLEAAADFLFN